MPGVRVKIAWNRSVNEGLESDPNGCLAKEGENIGAYLGRTRESETC